MTRTGLLRNLNAMMSYCFEMGRLQANVDNASQLRIRELLVKYRGLKWGIVDVFFPQEKGDD